MSTFFHEINILFPIFRFHRFIWILYIYIFFFVKQQPLFFISHCEKEFYSTTFNIGPIVFNSYMRLKFNMYLYIYNGAYRSGAEYPAKKYNCVLHRFSKL